MSDPVGATSSYRASPELGDDDFCLLDISSDDSALLEKSRLNIQNAFSRYVQPCGGARAICSEDLPSQTAPGISKKLLLRKVSELISGNPRNSKNAITQTISPHNKSHDTVELSSHFIPVVVVEEARCRGKLRSENEQGCIADISAEDDVIIGALGFKSYSATNKQYEELFGPCGPCFKDVSQNDQRNTCYLLSVSAAYLASQLGHQVLFEMFSEDGKGNVVVELCDEAIIGSVKVQVTKARLFTGKKEVFSYSSTGMSWVAALEKANYSLNLFLRQFYKNECANNPNDEKYLSDLRSLLNSALHGDSACLDYVDLLVSMGRFPCVRTDIGNFQASEEPKIIHFNHGGLNSKLVCSSTQELLTYLSLGFPVVLGTRKVSEKGKLAAKISAITQAAISGSPSGHAFAVLKLHSILENGKEVSGILVLDPAGEKKTDVVIEDAMQCSYYNPPPNSAVQFVREHDIARRFSLAVIAKGYPGK